MSTTAGGLKSHRVISPYLPDRVMSQVTPRFMALLARAPGLVDGARRTGSDIGFLVTSKMAFGTEVPTPYIEFVDEMLAQTPFGVIAEFFPNFDQLDKFAVLDAFELEKACYEVSRRVEVREEDGRQGHGEHAGGGHLLAGGHHPVAADF